MKIAITGKGGVGKTTLTGLLARTFAAQGWRVLALDADPDANLASTLPLDRPGAIEPLTARPELIAALSGRGAGLPPGLYALNPDVGAVLPDLRVGWGGGHGLIVLGWHKGGGQGCYCAENAVLRRLLNAVLTGPQEVVLVDSEAGLEHLSRGTARAVDAVLVVVEPGQRSLDTAQAIRRLAGDLGIPHIYPVLCGFRGEPEAVAVQRGLGVWPMLAALPHREEIRLADLEGRLPAIDAPLADILNTLAGRLTALAGKPRHDA